SRGRGDICGCWAGRPRADRYPGCRPAARSSPITPCCTGSSPSRARACWPGSSSLRRGSPRWRPGLLLLGWTALYVLSVGHATSLIPLASHSFGAGFKAMLVNGIAGAAGLGMVIPLFVPSRWRSRRRDEEDSADIDADADEYVSGMTPTARQPGPVPAELPARPLQPTVAAGGGRPGGPPMPMPYSGQGYGRED